MPTTKIQKLFFMFATVFLSVIFFVFYNSSLISGGFSLNIITLALREIPAEFIIAFSSSVPLCLKIRRKSCALSCRSQKA
jgi:hypothetical protein